MTLNVKLILILNAIALLINAHFASEWVKEKEELVSLPSLVEYQKDELRTSIKDVQNEIMKDNRDYYSAIQGIEKSVRDLQEEFVNLFKQG